MSIYNPDYYQRTKKRQNEYQREYYKNNREKIRKQQNKNRNKTEYKKVARVYAKLYRQKKGNNIKIKQKEWYQNSEARFRKYGITKEQYEKMLEKQNNKCLICEEEKILVIDHCHNSNKIRGLLCNSCNKGIGCFYEKSDSLSRASQYVKTS